MTNTRKSHICAWCVSLCVLSGVFSHLTAGPGPKEPRYLSLLKEADAKDDSGDPRGALQLYFQAEKLAPGDSAIHYRIALTAAELHMPELCLAAITNLTKIDPKWLDDREIVKLTATCERWEASAVSNSPPSQAESGSVSASSSRLPPDEALALRTAQLSLDGAATAARKDPAGARKYVSEALKELRPALDDPSQTNMDVWIAAANIAAFTKDSELAAYAFEAIQRLRPDYSQDPSLLGLVAALNRLPIAEQVKKIPEQRRALQNLLSQLGSERAGSQMGNAGSLFVIACAYDNGQGTPTDFKEAVTYYRRAAELGNSGAMCNLGVDYANGEGVEKDYSEAARWFRKAADLGNSHAMYNLGVCYENGHGVEQNRSVAVRWYRKAAEAGYADARAALRRLGVD